jgi:hypothetical protein
MKRLSEKFIAAESKNPEWNFSSIIQKERLFAYSWELNREVFKAVPEFNISPPHHLLPYTVADRSAVLDSFAEWREFNQEQPQVLTEVRDLETHDWCKAQFGKPHGTSTHTFQIRWGSKKAILAGFEEWLERWKDCFSDGARHLGGRPRGRLSALRDLAIYRAQKIYQREDCAKILAWIGLEAWGKPFEPNQFRRAISRTQSDLDHQISHARDVLRLVRSANNLG